MRNARRWGGWRLVVALGLVGCGSPEAPTLLVQPGFLPADGASTATVTLTAPGYAGTVVFTLSRGTFSDSASVVTNVVAADGVATATIVACDGADTGCLGNGSVLAAYGGNEAIATVTFVASSAGADGGSGDGG